MKSSIINNDTLVADSGSTKTDWLLAGHIFHTQGINPVHQDEQHIRSILTNELLPQLTACYGSEVPVGTVRFYGSGVRSDMEPLMVRLLRSVLPQATIVEAHSDLLGAAIALCGESEGIACILGTGSNSCLFDGHSIVNNIPPLGYILGDEGSGASLGIRFLGALYKQRLPSAVREAFETDQQMTLATVIDRVYRQPMANRWLASLSPFIASQLHIPEVDTLVTDNFRDFIVRNVEPYHRPDLPVSAVGSIAYYYRDQLSRAVAAQGFMLGKVMRSPFGT